MKLSRKISNVAKRMTKRTAKQGAMAYTNNLWFLPKFVRYIIAIVAVVALIQPWSYVDFIPNPITYIQSLTETVKSSVDDMLPDLPELPSFGFGSSEQELGSITVGAYDELANLTYDGEQVVAVNNNEPFFTEEEKAITDAFEDYSELDSLGRTGQAFAYITKELMPTEERESLSDVYPSGWNQEAYDFVDGGYLYNRCHLIAFALAGEQANEKNLLTGTRSMNVGGMLPYEEQVMSYVDEGGEVLYRVTPIYSGEDLLAKGVLVEAYSQDLTFSIFAFNVESGVSIDYTTGENQAL